MNRILQTYPFSLIESFVHQTEEDTEAEVTNTVSGMKDAQKEFCEKQIEQYLRNFETNLSMGTNEFSKCISKKYLNAQEETECIKWIQHYLLSVCYETNLFQNIESNYYSLNIGYGVVYMTFNWDDDDIYDFDASNAIINEDSDEFLSVYFSPENGNAPYSYFQDTSENDIDFPSHICILSNVSKTIQTKDFFLSDAEAIFESAREMTPYLDYIDNNGYVNLELKEIMDEFNEKGSELQKLYFKKPHPGLVHFNVYDFESIPYLKERLEKHLIKISHGQIDTDAVEDILRHKTYIKDIYIPRWSDNKIEIDTEYLNFDLVYIDENNQEQTIKEFEMLRDYDYETPCEDNNFDNTPFRTRNEIIDYIISELKKD